MNRTNLLLVNIPGFWKIPATIFRWRGSFACGRKTNRAVLQLLLVDKHHLKINLIR